jgi:hypothetical protein
MPCPLDFNTERRQRDLSNSQPLFVNWDAVTSMLICLVIGLALGKFVVYPLILLIDRLLVKMGVL